jgi:hypothetical protein
VLHRVTWLQWCYKILPHGVPNLIYDSAEDFGALDFKVCLTTMIIPVILHFLIAMSDPC